VLALFGGHFWSLGRQTEVTGATRLGSPDGAITIKDSC